MNLFQIIIIILISNVNNIYFNNNYYNFNYIILWNDNYNKYFKIIKYIYIDFYMQKWFI